MFIVTTRFTRKKAVVSVIIFGIIMAALILLVSRLTSKETHVQPELTDNQHRIQ